jgi:hypothetical protein
MWKNTGVSNKRISNARKYAKYGESRFSVAFYDSGLLTPGLL